MKSGRWTYCVLFIEDYGDRESIRLKTLPEGIPLVDVLRDIKYKLKMVNFAGGKRIYIQLKKSSWD